MQNFRSCVAVLYRRMHHSARRDILLCMTTKNATSEKNAASAAASGTITIGGDMTVNRMGYGAMRLTGEGIWGEPKDREGAKKVLQRAVELGVNFIDTADSYGPDVSERIIGEALAPYGDGVVVA